VQFKTLKPAYAAFACSGNILKDFISFNTFIVTNSDFGAVHECNPCTLTKTDRVEKKHHWNKNAMFYLHNQYLVVSELKCEFFAEIVHYTENFYNFAFGKYPHITFIILLLYKNKGNKNMGYSPLFIFFIPNSCYINSLISN
jgi:hypothetical protein